MNKREKIMKLSMLKEIFPDASLRHVMIGKSSNAQEMSRESLINNLLTSEKKERYAAAFKKSIAHAIEKKIHPKTCENLLEKIKKEIQKRASLKPNNLNPKHVVRVSKQLNSKKRLFSRQLYRLSVLRSKGRQLAAKRYKSASRIISKIKLGVKKDPSIKSLPRSSPQKARVKGVASKHNPPFEFNRAGKKTRVFLNWSDVDTEYQKFRLGACPRSLNEARGLFSTVIKDNVRVMVSLHQKTEAKRWCNDFWENRRLRKMNIGGWKIKKVSEKLLAKDVPGRSGKRTPKLLESTLIATRKNKTKVITHLHFDGWPDRSPVSSEKLFNKLLDRMQALNPSADTRIAINCVGGIGRTGSTAVAYCLRKYIDEKIMLKKPLKDLKVNIPDIIYQFRKQRSGIVGQPSHLSLLHSATGAYYERCKSRS